MCYKLGVPVGSPCAQCCRRRSLLHACLPNNRTRALRQMHTYRMQEESLTLTRATPQEMGHKGGEARKEQLGHEGYQVG